MKIIDDLRNRIGKREQGSEAISSLLLLPIAIFLIFVIFNVSTYFIARSSVENVVRDGARQVALYGGNSASVPRNNTGKDVSQIVFSKLYTSGKCTISHCTQPPSVTCAPNQASDAGQTVFCRVTYYYTPVAVDPFGFAQVTSRPFTLTEYFISETGY